MSDFLEQLAGTANKELGKQVSPYRTNREKSKPVQIRMSTYKRIRKLAFDEDRPLIDVVDDLIKAGYDSKGYNK